MPHINEKRKHILRKMLMQIKQKALSDIRKSLEDSMSEDLRMGFEELQDNGDKSVYEMLKFINASITDSRSETLDLIDAVLTKLDDGTYGVCEECGEEIPVGRLAAVPFTSHCVACQEMVDKKKKADQLRGAADHTADDIYDYQKEER